MSADRAQFARKLNGINIIFALSSKKQREMRLKLTLTLYKLFLWKIHQIFIKHAKNTLKTRFNYRQIEKRS